MRSYGKKRRRWGSGVRLATERMRLGMTHEELGAQLGVKANYICGIESGRQDVTEPIALKMFTKYGSDPNWLLYGIRSKDGSWERMHEACTQLHLTSEELSVKLGYRESAMRTLESGGAAVPDAVADRMQAIFAIDRNWLLYGEQETTE